MKSFKTFAEEMEVSLVRTIKQLWEENEHTKLPHHDTLTKHEWQHQRTTKDGRHEYVHPRSSDMLTVYPNSKWVHSRAVYDPVGNRRKGPGSYSGESAKDLHSHLAKLTDRTLRY
jgi:hypothetical protein